MRQRRRVGVAGLLGVALVIGAGGGSIAFAAGSWSIVASPSPAGASHSELNGVVCVTASNCTAVGESGVDPNDWAAGTTLVEHWNGTAWSVVPSPNPSGASESVLYSVSCPTATKCTAVGVAKYTSGSDYTYSTLVERWNGRAWKVVVSPSPAGAWNSVLEGVSCTSATSCDAVGYSAVLAAPNNATSLVEHWNGSSWTIVASPDPTGAGIDQTILTAVSCTAANSCTAVGTARFNPPSSPERYDTLVEHWNGSAWTITPSPNPNVGLNQLADVSCPTASSCMAVGMGVAGDGSGATTLVERWDGTTWSVVPSPTPAHDPNSGGSALTGVSCPSATSCTTVGGATSLVEQWNGSAWAIVPSPNPAGATETQLLHVSCTSAASCTAVGRTYTTTSQTMLIERSS